MTREHTMGLESKAVWMAVCSTENNGGSLSDCRGAEQAEVESGRLQAFAAVNGSCRRKREGAISKIIT